MTVIKAHSPGTSQIEEKDLGEEHARRYGRHRGYKKGSFELGWKIQPRTRVFEGIDFGVAHACSHDTCPHGCALYMNRRIFTTKQHRASQM